MPFLKGTCPADCADILAKKIMSKTLITVPSIADMASVQKALSSEHNAFPVLNTSGNLIGLIPKSILNVLVQQKKFYETRRVSIAAKSGLFDSFSVDYDET